MKITLFGATGMIGRRILAEALRRGHEVTAVARDTSKITEPGVRAIAGDILVSTVVAAAVSGADAAISAFGPSPEAPNTLLKALESLVAGLTTAHIHRVIVVGGAGSLEVAPGVALVDTPEFPAAWKSIARAHSDALDYLKTIDDLDWTYLSPSAIIAPGERTGTFRLGTEQLITDAAGESKISAEDYAVALLDEVEKPEHVKKRFTVGY